MKDKYTGIDLDDWERELFVLDCPACGSEQDASAAYMGNLGGAQWYLCRCCGHVFTTPPQDDGGAS